MTRTGWAAVAAAVLVGTTLGLGAFTFLYARGWSYLTSDPAACANCHVMWDHHAAWQRSSHRAVAGCNDCHTPHDLVGKYATKASNGFWHSFYFTTGRFPDPIQIKEHNLEITEHACRSCHAAVADAIDHGTAHGQGAEAAAEGEGLRCTRCHADVGHWIQD